MQSSTIRARGKARRRPRALAALVALPLFGLGAPRAGAATYSVGGAGCTHTTLAAALGAAAANAGTDEILLAQNVTGLAGPLTIAEQSVTIRGVVGCTDDTPLGRGIGFSTGDGLVMLGGASSSRTLTLARLLVTMSASAGRALRIENRSLVQIEQTRISGGNASEGANVRMIGPNAILVLAEGTEIRSGEATLRGGGIHCSGGGTVGMLEGVGIVENRSFGDGGGLYLDDCTLNAFAGGSALEGIVDNRADGSGGGIFATGGAFVNLAGGASGPASVTDNRAFVAGGGLLLDGATTEGRARNARIEGNFADTFGGGVYVRNGADFVMDRQGVDCHDALRCSSLSGNAIFATTAPGGDGGAIAVTGGATAAIRQTYLTGNDSYESGGTAYVAGTGSQLRVEGSMLYANGVGLSLDHFRIEDGGALFFAYNTTAANLLSSQRYFRVGADASASVYSSIFGETAGDLLDLVGPNATSPGDCVIRSRSAAIRGAWSEQLVATPESLFRDVASGDLHLRAGAAAIDFCDAFYAAPTDLDFDEEMRGVDWPDATNRIGVYDLGADEYVPEPGAVGGSLAALAVLAGLARRRRGRA